MYVYRCVKCSQHATLDENAIEYEQSHKNSHTESIDDEKTDLTNTPHKYPHSQKTHETGIEQHTIEPYRRKTDSENLDSSISSSGSEYSEVITEQPKNSLTEDTLNVHEHQKPTETVLTENTLTVHEHQKLAHNALTENTITVHKHQKSTENDTHDNQKQNNQSKTEAPNSSRDILREKDNKKETAEDIFHIMDTDHQPEKSNIREMPCNSESPSGHTHQFTVESRMLDILQSLDNNMCKISEYFVNKQSDSTHLKSIDEKLTQLTNYIEKSELNSVSEMSSCLKNIDSHIIQMSNSIEQSESESQLDTKLQSMSDSIKSLFSVSSKQQVETETHENTHSGESNVLQRIATIEQRLSFLETQSQISKPYIEGSSQNNTNPKNKQHYTTTTAEPSSSMTHTENTGNTGKKSSNNNDQMRTHTNLERISRQNNSDQMRTHTNPERKHTAPHQVKRSQPKNIRKFRGSNDPLSNLFMGTNKLKVNGSWYTSSEQRYQECKAEEHNRKDIKDKILRSKDTYEMMRLGRKITTTKSWDEKKKEVMRAIVKQKYVYVKEFRQALQETGSDTIEEDTADPFWGARNYGQNQMGKLLMEIRANPPPLYPVEEVANDKSSGNNVLCLVDSNGSQVHFRKLLPRKNVKVKKTYTIDQATEAVESHAGPKPDIVLIHTGTNDLIPSGNPAPQFCELIQEIKRKWNCRIVISKLLPRGGINISKKVKLFNNSIENEFLYDVDIHLIDHNDLLWGDQPNYHFYVQEEKEGRLKPLLHLNNDGLAVLASKFKHGIRRSQENDVTSFI